MCGVGVQIREILLADRAPGSGTDVKEVDGSVVSSIADALPAKDDGNNGKVTRLSDEATGVSTRQEDKDITVLGKAPTTVITSPNFPSLLFSS